MNEIEKLYENAEVKKEVVRGCYEYYSNIGIDIWKENACGSKRCETCKKDKSIKRYPSFTAKKQIAILQTLIFSNKAFCIGRVYPHNIIQINNDKYIGKGETFGEAIAEIINKLWADMPEEEKQQVKEILE